jgi:hypothetical protein
MFRTTHAVLGCVALLAGCQPEASQQVPQPTPQASQQTQQSGHRDTDAVYFRETASADGKFAERERRAVRYLEHRGYLIKLSSIVNSSTRGDEVTCRTEVSGFKNVAIGSYIKAWSFSTASCGAEMNGLHLMTREFGCCRDEELNSFYALASGKLLVKGTSLSLPVGNQNNSVIYDNSLQSTAHAGDELQGVIWLVNAERVLDRVDVTGLPEDSSTPEIITPDNVYKKAVTFKYDAAQYSLIVSDGRFEVPADSAAVFRKAPYQIR